MRDYGEGKTFADETTGSKWIVFLLFAVIVVEVVVIAFVFLALAK